MNKTINLKIAVVSMMLISRVAFAGNDLSFIKSGESYIEVKQMLISKGWKPIKNTQIEQSSLYAQEIHSQGFTEVTDCISMEIDACKFHYQKDNRILEVKTITRQLSVDFYRNYKKAAP